MAQEIYKASLWTSLGASLWASLFFYLGFVLAGDQEKADQLKKLLGFWQKYSILGFKTDKLETLLVLVK